MLREYTLYTQLVINHSLHLAVHLIAQPIVIIRDAVILFGLFYCIFSLFWIIISPALLFYERV